MPAGYYPRPTAEQRLDRDVDRSGECWIWTSKRNEMGYGMAMVNYVRWYAHRLSWTIAVGPIPDGMCVLHRCDNPPCVRPSHLFLGTRTDNARDRDQKGRGNLPELVCRRGHPKTPENTYITPRGGRECRTCRRINFARWREKAA